MLRELHAEHYVNAFFRIGVDHDPSDPSSSRSIIRVLPAGLGMADKSYYQHRLPDDPAVQAYQTFMKDSAQLFGASSPEAHKFSVDIFNFEKRIAEITPESAYLRDPVKTNNRMTVKDLHTMSMNIPWLEILKAAYSDAPMSEETEVIVASPQYAGMGLFSFHAIPLKKFRISRHVSGTLSFTSLQAGSFSTCQQIFRLLLVD